MGRSNGFAVLALLAGWAGFLPAHAQPTAPVAPVSAATSAPVAPVSAAAMAPANLPPVLLWLGDEPPLRSEQRRLEKLAKVLSTASDPMTLERVEGERAAALRAWLSSTDPTARAAMPFATMVGSNRAVLAVWLTAPKDRIGQIPYGFGLLANDPPRPLFTVAGMGPEAEIHTALKRILKAALVKP